VIRHPAENIYGQEVYIRRQLEAAMECRKQVPNRLEKSEKFACDKGLSTGGYGEEGTT
jgi:hypothetical protein